jgi:hypothetical protein
LDPVLPKRIENWSLTSLQQRLVKTGGGLIQRARHYWLMLAGSHPARRLFGSRVRRIAALAAATGWRKGDETAKPGRRGRRVRRRVRETH